MTTPAGSFAYGYDGDGRMTGLTNPFSEASSWTYLDNGWLWKQTLGNGATTTFTYNSLGLTTDLVNKTSGGTTLSDFTTPSMGGYDGAGNRTAVTASLPAAPSAYSGATSYAYDTKNQLTQEASYRTGGYTNTFGYDGAGNATTFRGASRTFNVNNQHTANTYDGNGNPTTYGGSACAFDPENRATAFGSVLTAGYTGDGLRAWKQASSGGKTYFLYDGETPVCELDSSGAVSVVNTFGAAGLLSRHAGGGSAFYTFDTSGNVAQRLSSTGGLVSSDTYDAFGGRVSTGSGDVFGFGGQWGYQTDETGLVLCTHRYYDPSTGRWLTRDPMGYDGGVNLYGYVGNNPVKRRDPRGYFSLPIWAITDAEIAEALGGGPEDPFADGVSGIIILVGFGWSAGNVIGGIFYGPQTYKEYGPAGSNYQCGDKRPSKQTGKQTASDAPSWAKNFRPNPDESCDKFTKRILDQQYGVGGWSDTGPGSEYSKIKKWCQRKLKSQS